ncbi:putative Phox domain, sorting nexin, PX domain superfamily [Helianthus annuus]|nr:putative Phox domain, sorting nexin, PX domain superfamily [Helianthus annuus]
MPITRLGLYRNFERLHRHLKAIPNYTLHLPPKRIFSSSTEDAFVHQRCIQLDKYLQDLLSIANIAEQHEVWDFLSMSSRLLFWKVIIGGENLSSDVGDAVDDTVRQFKGVSGGLKKKAAGPGLPSESSASVANRNVANSSSYRKEGPLHKVMNGMELVQKFDLNYSVLLRIIPQLLVFKEDPLGVPAEWAPPNVSLPLLNLVDKIFQLNRRGWLRRQVFWISKQILQLMMEDAIDDWLLRQIRFLRRDSLVAQGIYWIQDVTNQTDSSQSNESSCKTPSGNKNNKGSFEEQLEAARRASDIKKMILGSPDYIGQPDRTQTIHAKCSRHLLFFLQSAVCLKQFGYGLLERVLITVFPELQDIVTNIHEKKNDPAV